MVDSVAQKALVAELYDMGDTTTEEEYVGWWENEHIPLLRRMPGLLEVSRYTAVDGRKPAGVNLYEWLSTSVLNSSDLLGDTERWPQRIRDLTSPLERRLYAEQTSSNGDVFGPHIISMNVLAPEEGSEDDFERWYDQEHTPMLQKVPGFLRARRLKLCEGPHADPNLPVHCTIQEYASAGAWETPEFRAASSTEWRARVIANVAKMDRRVFCLEKRVVFQEGSK